MHTFTIPIAGPALHNEIDSSRQDTFSDRPSIAVFGGPYQHSTADIGPQDPEANMDHMINLLHTRLRRVHIVIALQSQNARKAKTGSCWLTSDATRAD